MATGDERMKWFYKNKFGQLWAFIIGVIVVPNIVEEIITVALQLNFENVIWYEVVDTGVMLIIGIPFMWWLLGKMEGYVIGMESLTKERKEINDQLIESNKRLSYMAYYDRLTGLQNREKMYSDLQEKVEEIQRTGSSETVIITLIDIDRFQQINDIMGHTIGDEVLQAAANRLQERLPESCTVYRHMTDEFAIIADAAEIPAYLYLENKTFPGIFSEPFYIENEEVFLSVSCGISSYAHQGETAEMLLRQADQALSKAKLKGGDQHQLFDPEMAEAAERKLKLEHGLRKATEDGSLTLHYQPQVELSSGRIVCVEALARWTHPELGPIPPNEFIPLAEETGLINLIGEWVVSTACKQLREWKDLGFNELVMAINVSPLQMKRLKFPGFLSGQLKKYKIDPEFFEVEVTESLMQNFDVSKRIFNNFSKIGIKVSIDDFGTGYSSLSVLGELPINYLKIDQAFVRQMDSNPKMRPIVKTIIQLGKNLGVELIAEGVEHKHLAVELAQYGCRYGQGYYFSRPVPAEQITELIRTKKSIYYSS